MIKLYTLNMLNSSERYMEIDELVIRNTIVIVDNNIKDSEEYKRSLLNGKLSDKFNLPGFSQIDFYNVQGETTAPKLGYLNWQDTYTPEGKLISHDVIQKFCTLNDPTEEDD